MDARLTDDDKLDAGNAERGYDAWKRAKIERGLAQSQDRESMIPVEQVARPQAGTLASRRRRGTTLRRSGSGSRLTMSLRPSV